MHSQGHHAHWQPGTAVPGDTALLSERLCSEHLNQGLAASPWVPYPVDTRATLEGGQRTHISEGRRDDPPVPELCSRCPWNAPLYHLTSGQRGLYPRVQQDCSKQEMFFFFFISYFEIY